MFYNKYFCVLPMFIVMGCVNTLAFAEEPNTTVNFQRTAPNPLLEQADKISPIPSVSPVRRINRQSPNIHDPAFHFGSLFRNFDGSGNNQADPQMGRIHSPLIRLITPKYGDGIQTLAGQNRPSARLISNIVVAQTELIPNRAGASDFLWQWGQFIDHDINLTDGIDPPEAANISVPAGDPYFDPDTSGSVVISLNRSNYDLASGTDATNPRQQINEISSWIDASNVYGSDTERASALRSNDGTGRLKTSAGNLLPFNSNGLANAGGDSVSLFLAGDVRANEQVGLTAMHTLFMREHNWHADRIAAIQPYLNGEQIYQRARQMVGAEIQAITYREFLPALLGRNVIERYRGYRPEVNGTIANIFSSAAFRYGHSALSPMLLRLNAQGNPIAAGNLALRDGFFSPQRIIEEGGIAPLLRGLASQVCQEVDNYIIDDVRNFLFGPPGAGGFDLAALNIQRGRDHGLPSYNETRIAFGLNRANSFAEVTSNTQVQNALAEVYSSVDEIDVWVGGLAEDIQPGALVGELISFVLKEQFEALRNADRFWYQRILNFYQLEQIRYTRLADIIRRNTSIGSEISDDVFHVRQTSLFDQPGI